MFNSFLIASISLLNMINAPVVDMRELPEDSSKIASQAYYSEQVNIIEETSGWQKIETAADGYQGWIKSGQLHQKQNLPEKSSTITASVNRCAAHVFHVEDTEYGPILTLPFDAKLTVLDAGTENSRWIKIALVDGREGFIQRGDVLLNKEPINIDQLRTFSMKFLGLPYTWGGRSSFGYDCSGFTQMLYRQAGISIPRDSKDQLKWEGFKNVALEEMTPGDLIFFGLDENRIRHVGMYIGQNLFIHSTVQENEPYIHVSSLSDPTWNGSGRFAYRAARSAQAAIIDNLKLRIEPLLGCSGCGRRR